MKVFLTGGTGLVGRAVVRALIERGDDVVGEARDRKRALAGLSRPVGAVEGGHKDLLGAVAKGKVPTPLKGLASTAVLGMAIAFAVGLGAGLIIMGIR